MEIRAELERSCKIIYALELKRLLPFKVLVVEGGSSEDAESARKRIRRIVGDPDAVQMSESDSETDTWAKAFLGVGMERWLELHRMVSAGGLELLGSGRRRVAYGIPGTGLCLKSYVQDSSNPVIAREISAFRFNGERNTCAQEGRYFRDVVKRLPVDLAAVFPSTLELIVLPEYGWSLVEERVVNADGSAPERFLPAYRAASPDARLRLLSEFLKLMTDLADHAVRFYDLQNVLVQWLGVRNEGAFRLRIVDFEPAARTFIPLDSFFKALVRAKVRRRTRRFLKLRLGVKRPGI